MLDPYPNRPVRRDSSVWSYVALFRFLASVAFLVVVVIFYNQEEDKRTSVPISTAPVNATADIVYLDATRIESTNCSDDIDCSRDFLFVEADICEHILEPPGTNCTNNCYIAGAKNTTCTETGRCVGSDYTECRGYCKTNADCETAIPFDSLWLTTHPTWTAYMNQTIVYYSRHICEVNRCVLIVMDMISKPVINQVTTAGVIQEPIGAASACISYLNASFVDERGACLDIQRAVLSTNVTDVTKFMPLETLMTPQFGLCTYFYTCSQLNQTLLALLDT